MCIAKFMYVEKPKRPIIWNRGSIIIYWTIGVTKLTNNVKQKDCSRELTKLY